MIFSFQSFILQGWYLYMITTRWFGMRIDIISATLLTAVVFASIPLSRGDVLSAKTIICFEHLNLFHTELNAALVGLALTYIASLIGMLQYIVRQSAEVENVVSVLMYGNIITRIYEELCLSFRWFLLNGSWSTVD